MRENRLNRQPSGRGRSTKRTRSSASDTTTGAKPAASAPIRNSALARAAARLPRPKNNFGFTRRALVLFGVLAVLGLSFASSLRVWLVQSQELAAATAQIELQTERVAQLESDLERWSDPAYVRTQARERLGWVMPGEVGYRVVDANGEVMSGTNEIEGVGASETNDLAARWWDKLATSMRHADEAPAQTDPLVNAESPNGAAVNPAAAADAAAQPAGR